MRRVLVACLSAAIACSFVACDGRTANPRPDRDSGSSPGIDGGTTRPPNDGGGPDMTDDCDACRADQVCVSGACVDVPAECPCPPETFCDLSSNTCVRGCLDDTDCTTGRICFSDVRECREGCREDAQCGSGRICEDLVCRAGCRADEQCAAGQICDALSCRTGCRDDSQCGSGQICEATLCRAGCRSDTDCSGAGAICDLSANVCRGGCRVDADCALEQVCGAGDMCEAGCRDDAGCGDGRICDEASGQCRDGCRTHDDCPLNSYCDASSQCHEGCGPDGYYAGITSRCPVGQACVPNTCASSTHCNWHCQPNCYGWDCASAPGQDYSCFRSSLTASARRCRQSCTNDSECAPGQKCTAFTTNPSVPGSYRVNLCADPCTTDADCSGSVDSYGDFNPSCTCRADGICRFTDTYICYQTGASYGL